MATSIIKEQKDERARQMIAPILSSLVAPSGGLASGDQFIYQGLLYKATVTIAQGGTITIGGNCALADSVTEQIRSLAVKGNQIHLNNILIAANQITDLTAYHNVSSFAAMTIAGYSLDANYANLIILGINTDAQLLHMKVFNPNSANVTVSVVWNILYWLN